MRVPPIIKNLQQCIKISFYYPWGYWNLINLRTLIDSVELVLDPTLVEGVSSVKLEECTTDINKIVKFKRIAATIMAPNVSDTSIRSVK